MLEEKPILVPHCAPQIPHGQAWDRRRASSVRVNEEKNKESMDTAYENTLICHGIS